MSEESGYSREAITRRKKELEDVARLFGFASVVNMNFPTTRLDKASMADLIEMIGDFFRQTNPTVIYAPYRGDVHSDHKIVFDAVAACTKWFRHGSRKRVLAYETLSETDFEMDPGSGGFRPNVFVDIGEHLDKKIEIMRTYSGELGTFPFPRSEEAIRALAALRGAAAGCIAAEAFLLLKEIQ
jgi:LmbE family N-acetylglucosaminyl deacetylase